MWAASARRRRSRDEVDDGGDLAAVILTSSDDEEANRDLSLEIVERARRRLEAKGAALTGARIEEEEGTKKKKKRKKEKGSRKKVDSDVEVEVERCERKRKKKRKDKVWVPEEDAKVVVSTALKEDRVKLDDTVQEELVGSPDSEVTEVNNAADNMVLQKLLRGPRYFDTQVCDWRSCCFNCGEEGHVAVNCTEERKRKPCFVCGEFGHKANNCLQVLDCFVCKRRGHVAKDCSNKRQRGVVDPKFCLQCGDYGHDMFSCRNSYSLEDLQEIQCYVCKQFGHLCCVDLHDSAPIEVSCYNCGQCGHAGEGCCKWQTRKIKIESPSQVDSPSLLCHACGEKGHFMRECTKRIKPKKWVDETSMPSRKPKKHAEVDSPSLLCHACGEKGHFVRECTKSIKPKKWVDETSTPSRKPKKHAEVDSPSLLCHACGEKGHFVRECTKKIKPKKWVDETSTPSRKPKKHADMAGSKSAPSYLGSRPHRRNGRRDWAGDFGSACSKKFEPNGFSGSSPVGAHRQSCKLFPSEPFTRDSRRGLMGDHSSIAWGKKFESNGSHKPLSFGPPCGSHKHFPTD